MTPPTPSDIAIRAARSTDADVVAALGAEAQNTYAALLPSFFRSVETEYWRSRFLRSLLLKDYFVFIAERRAATGDADCAGYIELFIKRTSSLLIAPPVRLLIDNIVVASPHRRTGVGSALLRFAEHFARENRIDIVELQVAAGNHAAIALYEQEGFLARSITMHRRLP